MNAICAHDVVLMSGPLGTRLQYNCNFNLGKNLTVFDLIELKEGQASLDRIYRDDIEVAQENHLPIIINAATFRASKNHLYSRGLNKQSDVKQINMACINFIKSLRDSYIYLNAPIYISAPLGSMNDAYQVDCSLTIETARQYHQEQLDIFKEAEIDFVHVVTLSSLSEAIGIAYAAQYSGVEYTIGFVLNENGLLLDGTALHDAISIIDKMIQKKPFGYFITCTHSSIISKLNDSYIEYNRIIGVQVNGSNLPFKVLATMTTPITDSPKQLARDVWQLRKKTCIKIIGGCCGTSTEHLREIARMYRLEQGCPI